MKRILSIFLLISVISALLLISGCGLAEEGKNENCPERTIVELNDNNYWKYFEITSSANNTHSGGVGSFVYEIRGALDFALYDDVVFSFDVIYFKEGETDESYQSYTMRIGCNAAGDAVYETVEAGITNVTVGKYLGIDGELVSFENYNWKVHFKSVTGKVIYTV